MALQAHSNAEPFISSKGKDTGLETGTQFLSETQKNRGVFEGWISLWNRQEPSDRTISESGSLKEHIYRGSLYHQTAMDWGKNEEAPEWFILRQPISSSN